MCAGAETANGSQPNREARLLCQGEFLRHADLGTPVNAD
jgi:hypothetical protein